MEDARAPENTDAALAVSLRAALRRVATRVRWRRGALALTLGVLAACAAVVAAGAWWVLDGVLDGGPQGGAGLAQVFGVLVWLLPPVLVGVGVAILWPVEPGWVARELDRRLALEDRTAAAFAVAEGRVRSRLSAVVTRDALAALEADPRRVDAAFPAWPLLATLRAWLPVARRVGVVLLAALALALLSRFVPLGEVGLPVAGGADAPDTGGADGASVPGTPARIDSDAPDAPNDPDEEQPDPGAPPNVEPPEPPEPPPPPPEPPAAPGARVEVVMSGEEFEPTDTVLALVSAWPTEALDRPRGYRLLLEIDGQVTDPGESLAITPERTNGLHRPLILNHLDGSREFLQAGEHEIVALLEPERGGAPIRSEAAHYRIRGDGGAGGGGGDDDGSGGGGEEPEPPPPPPPPPAGPPAVPDADPTEEEPGEAPDPEPIPLPEETEMKIVVPLVGAGDEIEKEGPRLVLSPTGGSAREAERRPLDEALPEARERAEAAVDRAGVRASDRDLVRRYFERLLRLSRGDPR